MAGKYRKSIIAISGDRKVTVYASARVSHALNVIDNMSMYDGVKILDLLATVYAQGKKDGARDAFQAIDGKVREAKTTVPHRNPGKPKKRV
jgi:hypothetical protein